MNAAARGYKAILIMPDNMSRERIDILRAYGAEVVLTPAAERMPGAIRKAVEIAGRIPGSFIPQQFENQANPDAHRDTTAVEIMEQMEGRLDVFVASSGTGGTITGTGEELRKRLPGIRILVVEPKGSPVLSGGEPGPHKLVGTSPGFVPSILNRTIYDEIIQVEDDAALTACRELARAGRPPAGTVWRSCGMGGLPRGAPDRQGQAHPVHGTRQRRTVSQHGHFPQ